MREDLLHFIWRCGKLQGKPLTTTTSQKITIIKPGNWNKKAGPDFFNALVEVGEQLWAGNVEMHLKSSDWYAHHHETDANYNNVILHVVWEDDVLVFRKDGSSMPTLKLKGQVSGELLSTYARIFQNSRPTFINCEKDFTQIDHFLVENWLDRLYIERLETKSNRIDKLLKKTNNDWESVLFALLAKNFGSKINGEYFLDRAVALDFSIVRKTSSDLSQLESLLFGNFGLLYEEDCNDTYYINLKKEYNYLAKKYDLGEPMGKPEFFGLRPNGFPTVRLSQLANLYAYHQSLFAKLIDASTLTSIYDTFEISGSLYWDNHFTFGKISKKSKKKLSKSFIDLVVINTLVPLKFCYSKYVGRDGQEELLGIMSEIKKEKNSIVDGFQNLGSKTRNALESQAKIHLHENYCTKNKCLQCALGTHLLNRNT